MCVATRISCKHCTQTTTERTTRLHRLSRPPRSKLRASGRSSRHLVNPSLPKRQVQPARQTRDRRLPYLRRQQTTSPGTSLLRTHPPSPRHMWLLSRSRKIARLRCSRFVTPCSPCSGVSLIVPLDNSRLCSLPRMPRGSRLPRSRFRSSAYRRSLA